MKRPGRTYGEVINAIGILIGLLAAFADAQKGYIWALPAAGYFTAFFVIIGGFSIWISDRYMNPTGLLFALAGLSAGSASTLSLSASPVLAAVFAIVACALWIAGEACNARYSADSGIDRICSGMKAAGGLILIVGAICYTAANGKAGLAMSLSDWFVAIGSGIAGLGILVNFGLGIVNLIKKRQA